MFLYKQLIGDGVKNKFLMLITLLFTISLLFSARHTNDTSEFSTHIQVVLCDLYDLLKNIFPVIIIVMVVLAGLIFVVGQILGAETRSRANVWATNILIYTVIGVLVILVIPYILSQIDPSLNLQNVCS